MNKSIRSLLKAIPPFKGLISERDELRAELTLIDPGHFYSPVPNMVEVARDQAKLFDRSLRELPGVDLNVEGQLELLGQLARFYGEQPFSEQAGGGMRYYFANKFFGHSDAIFLYCMMRFARPKRIIEIGSGFSSFVMLDTNERFFDGRIHVTFVEPYDERLRSRLKEKDLKETEILAKRVQEVDLARFAELGAGDILFVDSSHVAKIGSDVNRIVFEILPRLAKGVLIHFHDVFYPFEYPKEWVESGRYWNEDYMLRAFLQFNSAFRIRVWNQFLGTFHAERLRRDMPLCMNDTGGSLWLERL